MQDFYIYILKCNDGTYYTGHTDNIEKRLAEHMSNSYKCYTSTRLPIELVYLENFTSRYETLEAERKIKKWGKEKRRFSDERLEWYY